MLHVQENFALHQVCTFKIGGNAKYFITCKSQQDLLDAISFAQKNNSKIFVFGGGTNLLFPDEGLNATVIRMMNSQIEILDYAQNDIRLIKVGAGTSWVKLNKFCADNSLYGLEAFSGLPGTIGGATFGNAGAHKVEMKNVIESVNVYDLNTKSFKQIKSKELKFDYRYSSFKENLNYIIVEVIIKVSTDSDKNTGDPVEFANFRKQNQPQGLTTGSFFKNPTGNFAGKLIEDSGMKDFRIGGITTSDIHANFFINLGDASAKDVVSLKDKVIATVKQKSGVELAPEVQIIDSHRLIKII